MTDPCRWPKGDPRYINPTELLSASLRERLEYRRISAIEDQNLIEENRIAIEHERNQITLQSIKRSVQGAIIAASIGAIALIYVNVFKDQEGKKIDKLMSTMVNFKQLQSDLHYLYNSQRQADVRYRGNEAMLRSIHKKLVPEENLNDFGRIKFNNKKTRK